ncbi:MAG: hypothetical protein UU37_C0001G0012 [Candidatus Gottesmanbacteria bacterium GW2011_GWA2_41_12]|uniref:Aminotransferase class I/classII large domain-containing protein n=1 Tax=Candidatus Gottesmanbacteria bacterium GW2011_GWA2_41_12 TaxID=1618440 RepID=A0A0G0UII7_9BACT|nr:MAG: hypothetical protein UU37_C0001G0012 [Candidatus Gottesmanbacteria bacterium GW2011_GWA2_41_12]
MENLEISNRGKNMPASPIRKLAPLAVAAKKRGIKVYHLNIGQPDLPTPPEIIESVKNFPEKTLAYAPSEGIDKAVSAWQRYYGNKGVILSKEDIIVTSGGSEAIIFAMMAITDPGDEIIVLEPFYTNYEGFAAMSGINLVPVTLSAENGFHIASKEQIEKKITDKTRGIIICNPNNPTGTLFSENETAMIVDIAKKFGLFILSDETYQEIVFDEKTVTKFSDYPGIEQNLIILDSISKRFNSCGARVGCLASKNTEIIASVLKMGQARLSVATVEQLAAIPLLENSKDYTDQIRIIYEKRRNAVCEGLNKIDGVQFLKPEGAFYLIARLPIEDAEKFATYLLTEFNDNNETVMVAPAAGFYKTEGLGKNEIRIAYVLEEKALTRAMKLLGIALKNYKE